MKRQTTLPFSRCNYFYLLLFQRHTKHFTVGDWQYISSLCGVCRNRIWVCVCSKIHIHTHSLSLSHTHIHTDTGTHTCRHFVHLSIISAAAIDPFSLINFPIIWLTAVWSHTLSVYVCAHAWRTVKVMAPYLQNPPGTWSRDPGPLPILLCALGTHVTPVAYLQMGT